MCSRCTPMGQIVADGAAMPDSQIRKAVARRMVELEVTITEAAAMAGVHRTTLSRWLRGEVTLRSDDLGRLLRGLGLGVVGG